MSLGMSDRGLLSFQYSIGDAIEGREVGALAPNFTFNTPLEMRLNSREGRLKRSTAFNTPLEMHIRHVGTIAALRALFQYSIGDAADQYLE